MSQLRCPLVTVASASAMNRYQACPKEKVRPRLHLVRVSTLALLPVPNVCPVPWWSVNADGLPVLPSLFRALVTHVPVVKVLLGPSPELHRRKLQQGPSVLRPRLNTHLPSLGLSALYVQYKLLGSPREGNF